MTSSSAKPSNGRSCLKISLWLVMLVLCIGLAIFSFATSPASAAFFETATPTQENLWGYMDLPKARQAAQTAPASPIEPATAIPTFTSTPEPTVTPTAEPLTVTDTPGQLTMEIVENTSASNGSEQAAAPAPSYGGSKYILVDISEQHLYAYDGDMLVYSFVASTGMNNATRAGTFAVQSKIPNAYGSTWNIWMPNWLGIYWSGGLENGIHALPILPNGAILWDGYLGTPISYGCVVLGTYESQLLYDWAEIGTPVEIQW